jgi:hypothetical protein
VAPVSRCVAVIVKTGVSVALAAVLVSACNSPARLDAAFKQPSTCKIVPGSQVAAVLGTRIQTLNGAQARSSNNPRLLYECYYLLPRQNRSLFIAEVELARATATNSGLVKTLAERASTEGSLHQIDGTVAAWNPYPSSVGGGGRLTATRKGAVVLVTVTNEDRSNPLGASISIMHYAFTRLDAGVAVPA